LLAEQDAETALMGERKKCRDLLLQVRKSFHEQDCAALARVSDEFLAMIERIGAREPGYARRSAMGLELAYHDWAPFRWGWALLVIAAAGMCLHAASRWHTAYLGSLAAYIAGLAAVAIGLGLRTAIAGRPPVASMYDFVACVAAGVAVLGLMLSRSSVRPLALASAATVSAVLLALADRCPLILDPAVRTLEPVLRNNLWLVAHVVTIALSFAGFAMALATANITLGYYLLGRVNLRAIRSLTRCTHQSLEIGFVLLAVGIALGAMWADSAWGRFWGWDPKEVWALIALLCAGAVLHSRQAGWAGHRGLAVGAIASFYLVVMAWYGVNFAVGTGMHHYGWGHGGQAYVALAGALQLIYLGAALLRSWCLDADQRSTWRPAGA
jgi:ABC-type transport system involved in cytochrome c biogenesis permease subunit